MTLLAQEQNRMTREGGFQALAQNDFISTETTVVPLPKRFTCTVHITTTNTRAQTCTLRVFCQKAGEMSE